MLVSRAKCRRRMDFYPMSATTELGPPYAIPKAPRRGGRHPESSHDAVKVSSNIAVWTTLPGRGFSVELLSQGRLATILPSMVSMPLTSQASSFDSSLRIPSHCTVCDGGGHHPGRIEALELRGRYCRPRKPAVRSVGARTRHLEASLGPN